MPHSLVCLCCIFRDYHKSLLACLGLFMIHGTGLSAHCLTTCLKVCIRLDSQAPVLDCVLDSWFDLFEAQRKRHMGISPMHWHVTGALPGPDQPASSLHGTARLHGTSHSWCKQFPFNRYVCFCRLLSLESDSLSSHLWKYTPCFTGHPSMKSIFQTPFHHLRCDESHL